MARELVSDELWALIEPLLPPPKAVRTFRDGRPPKSPRAVLEAILIILKTGIGWEDLPPQFGMSGMTCSRRMRDWSASGVWLKLQVVLIERLHQAGAIDWSRCFVDSSNVRAIFGGRTPDQTPRIAAKRESNTTSRPMVRERRSSST